MLHERFQQAKNVMNTLINNGFECYFVGGAVRDFLLGLNIKDVDIATNAKPEDVMRIFPRTIPVGIDHGTVLVLDQDEAYEITTYRIEDDYEDYRHPNRVEFVNNITLDLSRRDFTINAMAMDIEGNIIDPFKGEQHLKLKKIKTVGKAADRFNEDPLRMLRGLRFTSQLGFTLDEEVKDSIQLQHHLLEHISVERITEEMFKLFQGPYIKASLPLLLDTNIYLSLPVFKEHSRLMNQLVHKIDQPIHDSALLIALFHLFHPTVSVHDWSKVYKLSNSIKKGALHLVQSYHHYKKDGLSNELIYYLQEHWLKSFIIMIEIVDEFLIHENELFSRYENLPIKSRKQLAITGDDFKLWFPNKKRGKWVGDMLKEIETLVVKNKLNNDYDSIESVVKKWEITEED